MLVEEVLPSLGEFIDELSANRISQKQAVSFLKELQLKPLVVKDTVEFVKRLFLQYPRKESAYSSQAVNLVGTGGGRSTFNISTTAAFVAAAAGAVVIKSGSYSYTSRCGTLGLLKQMGVRFDLSFQDFEVCLAELGIGFINPQWYPPLLKRLAIAILPESFKSLGGYINTIGPLLAPVRATAYLVGANSPELVDILAGCAHELELGKAIVCWSELGFDEFCPAGKNYYRVVDTGGPGSLHIYQGVFSPASALAELSGGDPAGNEIITRGILAGSFRGIKRQIVLLNSAYALQAAGKVGDLTRGLELSAEAIDSGAALRKLQEVIKLTDKLAKGG